MKVEEYRQRTSKIYGKLFANYDDELFEESVALFQKRHLRWGFDLDWFQGKTCLDAGCGGGRYLVALARLGAKEVKGIDISSEAITMANARLKERGLTCAQAMEASVLEIPFPDKYFDYVVSSGVIHHTPNPYRAFRELVRVLKPGGKLFLSVYGRGGLKWFFKVDLWRHTICRLIPFWVMEKIFERMGAPANKRYAWLDNLYVPYCFRFTEKEIREWLVSAGFRNLIKREI